MPPPVRRWLLPVLVASVLTALLGGASATAAEADEIADAVFTSGGYAEPGSGVDEAVLDRLAGDFAAAGHRLGLVVLASTPAGGATILAENVLESVGTGTVVVRTPDEIGVASEVYDDAAVDAALDAAIDEVRADLVGGLAAFGNALTGADVAVPEPVAAAPDEDASGDAGGGGGGPSIGTVLLVLLVLGGGLLVWRSRRRSARDREQRLEEARGEIARQLSTIADRILALDDRVRLATDAEVERAFLEATATYQAAQDRLAAAEGLATLRELADDVDHARWQLAVVEAHLDGRPPPPEPADRPGACFFDPDHPAATEDAVVRTPAGERRVGVCPTCAERLRAGERPDPRTIPVGGEPVPAPAAPREHGGGGLSWLGPALEILVDGMARGATYEMGRPRTRRRGVRVGRSGGIPTPPSWGGGGRSGGGGRRTGGSGRARSPRRITKGRGGRRL